ncbi:DUF4304 domain-containing protein [Actinokineospora auranticolor]|uniref:Uncharacterized protein DUF4304 n=1 Tax=Actinokineospora auranticolor TaxID=155976 RepID=A0A2S6GRU4_9PSEU|nr:DUF4304 domain-containing protein [Actinokineospora auranticolor]PPK67962.1 uncharacterized protein DUF4304 [Actinokineospora auranticolor]
MLRVGGYVEAGAVRNADEWFRLMVETGLAPGLRALGLAGTGRTFKVVRDAHVGQVSILQSTRSSAYSTRFTLSLSVTPTDEWASQLRIRPYALAAGHRGYGWQERIGNLMLVGGGVPIGDLWWKIEAGKPFASLSDEVLTAVREFGIPAIEHQISARVH